MGEVKSSISQWNKEFNIINNVIKNPVNSGWNFYALGRISSMAMDSFSKFGDKGYAQLFNDYLLYYMSIRNIA